MKKIILRALLSFLIILCGVIVFNLSFFHDIPEGDVKILSHRGVHQTYYREGLTNHTCTAERIHPVSHTFIENTIPSVRAAFGYGADMVEIDVRRTADNQFAVFHDYMLECRTNGKGDISEHTMDELRGLDVGYGYTADNGKTYPLRGLGAGMMVSLAELLRAFPDRIFQINVKSNSAREAEILSVYLEEEQIALHEDTILWAGPRFARRWRVLNPDIPVAFRRIVKECAKKYILWGWTGQIADECASYGLVVPQNFAWLYWGWPRKTLARFEAEDIPVILVGPYGGEHEGIETLEQVRAIPEDYRGWVITNKIETTGPAIKPSIKH